MQTEIENRMENLIRDFFTSHEFQSITLQFVDYQSSMRDFTFGKLVVLHYDMFNGKGIDITSAAVAIELVVLAADLFDDIADGDNLTAPWQIVDRSTTINIGNGLVLLSKKILDNVSVLHRDRIDKVYYDFMMDALTGQHLDIHNTIASEEEYLELVRKKSGSLTALACVIGASLANSNSLDLVGTYGKKLGVIAQINNDIRAIYDWEGKSDIRLRKRTLPMIYMINRYPQSFIADYNRHNCSFDDLQSKRKTVVEEMEKKGAIRYAQVIMEIEKQQANRLINQLPIDHDYKLKIQQYFS